MRKVDLTLIMGEADTLQRVDKQSKRTRLAKPSPYPVTSIHINRVGTCGYDFICNASKVDAHLSYQKKDGWILDVFHGSKHVDSVECGKRVRLNWNKVMEQLL